MWMLPSDISKVKEMTTTMDIDQGTGQGGFLFIWSIEKFSHCWHEEGEQIDSPEFVADTLYDTKWNLVLYPRGDKGSKENYIGYFLQRNTDKGPVRITVDYKISIFGSDGSLTKTHRSETFEMGDEFGFISFLPRDKALGRKGSVFSQKDILMVCCRIWRSDADNSRLTRCFARTQMKVENRSYILNLDNFGTTPFLKRTFQVVSVSEEDPTLFVNISLSGGSRSEEAIRMEIEHNEDGCLNFCTCKISVVDVEGKVINSEEGKHWFEDSQPIWNFPPFISKRHLLAKESQYSLNDIKSLRFDFTICHSVKFSGVEYLNYGPPSSQTLGAIIEEMGNYNKHFDSETENSNPSESLRDDLQCLYSEKKFSDAILKTQNSSFPIHKAVLCARSPVFSARFQRDLEIEQSGVIEIEDMDDDILQRMLLFVYTDRVDELDWKRAFTLYLAANEYGILRLKEKCSHLLISNLTPANVCEVLAFADLHKDRDMKSSVQNFIFNYDSEIIGSVEWNNFKKRYLDLANATLLFLYKKKLQI